MTPEEIEDDREWATMVEGPHVFEPPVLCARCGHGMIYHVTNKADLCPCRKRGCDCKEWRRPSDTD